MSNEVSPILSPSQKRIVAAGATALATVFLLATFFYLFVLLRHFVGTFKEVLLPLAIAAILATLLRPITTFVETRTRLNRVQGIVLLYLLVILVLGVAAAFALPAIFDQGTGFLKALPHMIQNLMSWVQDKAPAIWTWLQGILGEPPDEYVKSVFENNTELIRNSLERVRESMGTLAGMVGSIFGKVAAYSIIPIYLFFILNSDRDVWRDLDKQLNFLPKNRRDDLLFLAREFSEILVSFFRGQIIIGLLLGLVLAIGFFVVGLKFAILIGLILGLLNIIPYLGTMIGIITVLPIAYFQEDGGPSLIVACAVVFVIGQLLTDYVFTPKVMGGKTGMGPMLIIFSVFFWGTALGGLLGMILAIPLTAFFLVFWRLAREKYLPALTAKHEAAQTTAN
ncbi:AI-2E family transporter [Coraliomargarita parva]|uniref:AI-2E family transporter n=1 Tax=Coraliomargarita parva TaxID=3014050 RepID=UPI0022B366CF|nr:AI-2E family transporter [Coraliomargarita parva]